MVLSKLFLTESPTFVLASAAVVDIVVVVLVVVVLVVVVLVVELGPDELFSPRSIRHTVRSCFPLMFGEKR